MTAIFSRGRWVKYVLWTDGLAPLGAKTCAGQVILYLYRTGNWLICNVFHHSDVTMSVIASQLTGVSIACSTVCSGRKHQSYASSDAENASISWRHHVLFSHNHGWNIKYRCRDRDRDRDRYWNIKYRCCDRDCDRARYWHRYHAETWRHIRTTHG